MKAGMLVLFQNGVFSILYHHPRWANTIDVRTCSMHKERVGAIACDMSTEGLTLAVSDTSFQCLPQKLNRHDLIFSITISFDLLFLLSMYQENPLRHYNKITSL